MKTATATQPEAPEQKRKRRTKAEIAAGQVKPSVALADSIAKKRADIENLKENLELADTLNEVRGLLGESLEAQ